MSHVLENLMRGLTLHFLHQGTVEQAIEQGRRVGVPEELLESLPGMMFEITSAACVIQTGDRTLDDVADQIAEQAFASGTAEDFGRDDVVKMLEMTLAFIQELYHDSGEHGALPDLTVPWFRYEQDGPTSHWS